MYVRSMREIEKTSANINREFLSDGSRKLVQNYVKALTEKADPLHRRWPYLEVNLAQNIGGAVC